MLYCFAFYVTVWLSNSYINILPNCRVVSMGGCSLALTMVLYLTEALYFRSCTLNFYVIFPCVLNCKSFIYTYICIQTIFVTVISD